MFTGTEKRAHTRAIVILPTETKTTLTGDSSGSLTGMTEDVSNTGLRLKVTKSEEVAVEDTVYIKLATPNGDGYINLRGAVRWIENIEDEQDMMRVGIELIGMNLSVWDEWLDVLQWHDD